MNTPQMNKNSDTHLDIHLEHLSATQMHQHNDETTDSHAHSHSHHHVNIQDTSGSRLLMTLGLNIIIPIAQILGGILANSVALISDAAHNFSDSGAILISYIAIRIGRKGATVQNTFGYRRAEILAAQINVVMLIGAAAFIVFEAVQRFQNPQPVIGRLVMGLAAVGIAGNGLSACLLHRDSKHSLNVRGAFLHMIGDLLTSVVVFINGLVLIFRPWYWIDPVLSILIVVFILKNCWGILKESGLILMNATPRGLDLEQIRNQLLKLPDVVGIHYMHAWNVSSTSVAYSCHIEVADQPVSRTEEIGEKIRHDLWHKFGIDHPVLQFETAQCGNGGMLCEISCGTPIKGL
jgi:cation diffusion facilitator family transporter